jgi:predicted ArsR family transcriptional regulator
MRYIKLEETARLELEKVYHTHAKSYVRQRAHCLLLSNRKYRIPELAGIFSTRTHTVRSRLLSLSKHGLIDGNQMVYKALQYVPAVIEPVEMSRSETGYQGG